MEDFAVVRDFALILIVASVMTIVFRLLRQPPILGYLIAGLIVGPYSLRLVTGMTNVSLLADLGLVLLLFGIGLEFSFSKIRAVGFDVLLIGTVNILTMLCLGYGLGRLMGWSVVDSLFLSAAMHVTSSAIIVKVLSDTGRLDHLSSRLVVGIMVMDDFSAVVAISLLSGLASAGDVDLREAGFLTLRLVVFVVASLVFGALLVPRILNFTQRFHSREALLITSLGLCFAMAMIGHQLQLSVAAGAFIIGSVIAETRHRDEIAHMVSPIRDMFAAVFFVAFAMLIDLRQIGDFIVPALIVIAVFVLGKIVVNTLVTFMTGHDGRTSLQVGMSTPQMGEFSMAIAKTGVDRAILTAPLYPVVTLTTIVTSLVTPYTVRLADPLGDLLERHSPPILRSYISRMSAWLQDMRASFRPDSGVSGPVRRAGTRVAINLLIIGVIVGTGTLALEFIERAAAITHVRADFLGLGLGIAVLLGCAPCYVAISRNLHVLADRAGQFIVGRRPAFSWGSEGLRQVIRGSITIVLSVLVATWSLPFIVGFLDIGPVALATPIIIIGILLYLVVNSVRHIHAELEKTFSRVLLGEEHTSHSEAARILGIHPGDVVDWLERMKTATGRRVRRGWGVDSEQGDAVSETETDMGTLDGAGGLEKSKPSGDDKSGGEHHNDKNGSPGQT